MIGGLAAILGCIASALAVAGTTEWREATGSQLAAALASAPGGRPKVVHVWASWCRPCAADLPRLLPELRRRAGDFDVVLIALDEDSSARRAAWLLRRSGGAPGLNLRAGSASALAAIRAFDESWDGSLPATYLISAEGQLLVAQRGITELDALLSEMDRTAPATSRSKEGRRPR